MLSLQVLIPPSEGLMGSVVDVVVTSASRWSVTGTVLQVVHAAGAPKAGAPTAPLTPDQEDMERMHVAEDRGVVVHPHVGVRRVDAWLWVAVCVSALGVCVGVCLQLFTMIDV